MEHVLLFILVLFFGLYLFFVKKKANALCIAGGGYQSAAGAFSLISLMCQEKKSTLKDLLKKYKYASGNSGGSWAIGLLLYSNQFAKDCFDSDLLSGLEFSKRLERNLWTPMSKSVHTVDVGSLLFNNSDSYDWNDVVRISMHKYGKEIEKRTLADTGSVGANKRVCFPLAISSRGILENPNELNVFGQLGLNFVDPTVVTTNFVYNKQEEDLKDPINDAKHVVDFAPIYVSNSTRPNSLFPCGDRLNVTSSFSTETDGAPTYKQKVDTKKMYDSSQLGIIDVMAGSSAFFGILDNDRFRNTMMTVLDNWLKGHKSIVDYLDKHFGKDLNPHVKPGITQSLLLDGGVLKMKGSGFDNDLESNLNDKKAMLKISDGGYFDNSAICCAIREMQKDGVDEGEILFLDGGTASIGDSKGKGFVYGANVDQIFGLSTKANLETRNVEQKAYSYPDDGTCYGFDYKWAPEDDLDSNVPFWTARRRCMRITKVLSDTKEIRLGVTEKNMTGVGFIRAVSFEAMTVKNCYMGIEADTKIKLKCVLTDSAGASMLPFNQHLYGNQMNIKIASLIYEIYSKNASFAKVLESFF